MDKADRKNINKVILDCIGIIVLLYAAVFVFGMTKAAFLEADIPNEYQEVTNIQLTECFLKGVNPYSLKEAFGNDTPGLVYEYGFIYSLITAFFAAFIHIDIIVLHYLVSFISMLIASILGMIMVKEHTDSLLPPVMAFLLVLCCTWRYGYINAVPDSMAFMFSILALFIETRRSFKHREAAEIICITAAFFTKIYMAYIAIPLFIYKLIKDRKAAIRFMIYGILIAGTISAVVTIICPMYWTYAVYFLHGPWKAASGPASAGRSSVIDVLTFKNTEEPHSGWGYEVLQLRSLIGMFLCMFVLACVGIIEYTKKGRLKSSDIMFLTFVDMVTSIPVMAVLGTNDGAWLSYYLQIQMFPVIVFSLIYLEKKCTDKSRGTSGILWGWLVVCVLSVTFTVYRVSERLPYYYMTDEQRQVWDNAYSMLDEYAQKGEIYYSPVFGFHAVKNDRFFYNNGLAGRSMIRLNDEYRKTPWQQKLFPYAGDVMKKRIGYLETLRQKIEKGDFVLVTGIVGDDGTDRVLKAEDIDNGPYEILDILDIPVSRVNYRVTVWNKEE